MNIDLSGHTALITGASGELGRVMARTLGRCGADVAVHYLGHAEQAERVADEVRTFGVRSCVVQADITQRDAVRAMAETITQTLGAPDIVVANAVIQIHPWTSVLEEDVTDYESQFASCVMQSVYLAKEFIPGMKRGGYGRFIAINTECAIEAAVNSSAYVAGKRGLDGLLRVLAKEVGEDQITVNQVAPGWMIGDRDRASANVSDALYKESVPMKRRGDDQDIANLVAFLASPLASYITGSFIPVCGGRVMVGI